jgi:hypothetical protein
MKAKTTDKKVTKAAARAEIPIDEDGLVSQEYCDANVPGMLSTYRIATCPRFIPEANIFQSVGQDENTGDTFTFEWDCPGGRRIVTNWGKPDRIIAEDEAADTPDPATPAINLFGDKIPTPIVRHKQLSLFDKAEYRRVEHGSPAVILRENGEKTSGVIDVANRHKAMKKPRLAFTAHETGSTFHIPLRCCTMTWAGDIAILSIAEEELKQRTSLWGMFTSCRLRLLGF